MTVQPRQVPVGPLQRPSMDASEIISGPLVVLVNDLCNPGRLWVTPLPTKVICEDRSEKEASQPPPPPPPPLAGQEPPRANYVIGTILSKETRMKFSEGPGVELAALDDTDSASTSTTASEDMPERNLVASEPPANYVIGTILSREIRMKFSEGPTDYAALEETDCDSTSASVASFKDPTSVPSIDGSYPIPRSEQPSQIGSSTLQSTTTFISNLENSWNAILDFERRVSAKYNEPQHDPLEPMGKLVASDFQVGKLVIARPDGSNPFWYRGRLVSWSTMPRTGIEADVFFIDYGFCGISLPAITCIRKMPPGGMRLPKGLAFQVVLAGMRPLRLTGDAAEPSFKASIDRDWSEGATDYVVSKFENCDSGRQATLHNFNVDRNGRFHGRLKFSGETTTLNNQLEQLGFATYDPRWMANRTREPDIDRACLMLSRFDLCGPKPLERPLKGQELSEEVRDGKRLLADKEHLQRMFPFAEIIDFEDTTSKEECDASLDSSANASFNTATSTLSSSAGADSLDPITGPRPKYRCIPAGIDIGRFIEEETLWRNGGVRKPKRRYGSGNGSFASANSTFGE